MVMNRTANTQGINNNRQCLFNLENKKVEHYERKVDFMNIDFKSMEVKKSTEYFKLTDDELLENWNEYGHTREECKLFDDGLNVTFFDDMEELETEAEQFSNWIESQRYKVKALVKTVNGRIAVVLIQRMKQWFNLEREVD